MKNRDKEQRSAGTTMAETIASDLGVSFESCLLERRADPCIILIVGASGDLTSRKLVPALYNLYLKKALPRPFLIGSQLLETPPSWG